MIKQVHPLFSQNNNELILHKSHPSFSKMSSYSLKFELNINSSYQKCRSITLERILCNDTLEETSTSCLLLAFFKTMFLLYDFNETGDI
jgi:hypothetical protein